MFVRASVGSALLLFTAACAGRTGVETRPINPDNGPKATIRASMSGPAMYRQVDANFRLDKPGYVVVGHLGGDGMIRVIYPETPEDRGNEIPARTWIRTDAFDAPYDFAPQRYTFMSEPFRNAGAGIDSYDGRGHGFIFLITSYTPFNMAPLMDGFAFGELDIKDYGTMLDPRLAVRRVADAIAGRNNYTLKFASAFSTYNHSAYSYSYGCAHGYSTLFGSRYYSPFSFGSYDDFDLLPAFWSAWGMPTWYVMPWQTPRMGRRCGSYASAYYNRVLFVPRRGSSSYPWIEPIVQVADTQMTTPVTPILTRLRPTVGDSGRAAKTGGRSGIDRHTIVTRTRDSDPIAYGRRAFGSRSGVTSTTEVRTHAGSYERPGATRVLNERTYQRPAYSGPHVRSRGQVRDTYSDWMRERSPRPSGGSLSGPSAASGQSSASGSTTTRAPESSGAQSSSRGPSADATQAAKGRGKQ